MKNNFTSKTFAQDVFDDKKMRKYLPKNTYKAIINAKRQGPAIDKKHIDVYANALKKWAQKRGVVRYTHWFQPLNNLTAEKRDSLNSIDKEGNAIVKFRGKELLRGEGDASSFPNGGMRDTFEARGITNWDYTAYPFIKGDCLCIPTTFCGAGGEVLDKKTPLINSAKTLNTQTLRMLKAIGFDAKQVCSVVGAEQEYFLINKDLFDKRKDLVYTGRTLFGKVAPKGQEFDDHYFRPPEYKVIRFMQEVDERLWKLGIVVKTEHNEVAPRQYELAPCYTEAKLACDQNQLIMETLRNVGSKHNFACLLHEKPFDKINGSGKHNNWSLIANEDVNLLEAGTTAKENARFLLVLCAIIQAVDTYNDLLVAVITSANNDLRLGGYEAPPTILTVFLGEPLTNAISTAISPNFKFGKDLLPKDIYSADRNRTSPIAFCGNKFEFRAVGSSACIADLNTVLNTIVADSFMQFADKLEQSSNVWETAKQIVAETIANHSKIVYNGNGYSDEWIAEANKRGLKNLTTASAKDCLSGDKAIALFTRHNVLTEQELNARKEIDLQTYCDTIRLESVVATEIFQRQITPTVEAYQNSLATLAYGKQNLDLDVSAQKDKIRLLEDLQGQCEKVINQLNNVLASVDGMTLIDKATVYGNEVRNHLQSLRKLVNELEAICPKNNWPLPTYGQLLFGEK